MKTTRIILSGFALLILAAGCATGRSPVASHRIEVYSDMPMHAKAMGTVSATSFYGITLKQAHHAALTTLKAEADQLGANGIVTPTFDERPMEGVKAQAEAVYVSE